MKVLTIPKNLAQNDDLVVLPRREYEIMLSWKKEQDLIPAINRKFKEFTATVAEKRALRKARQEMTKGNYLTIDELKRELGFTR